jgi:hypothetical protein
MAPRPCPGRQPQPPGAVEIGRRAALERLLALTLASSPAASILTACGPGPDGRMREGMPGRRMPDWMMSSGGMDPQMMQDMPVIHELLLSHRKIDRRVEDIPGGIRSWTTSADGDIADLIRTHVHQMKARLERGDPIREMDPLFREILKHGETIRMEIANIPEGVRVTETSPDPQVALLIRQHAHRAVSQFVAAGMPRAMQPTPLPQGYHG